MSQIAVFIDAGYFWKQAGHVVHGTHEKIGREDVRIDYAVLREQVLKSARTQFPGDRLLRVYWYDGPDMQGAKTASHRAIEGLDDFKLRLGIRSGGDRKQKAVDGLIIADIIGLAQSKAITGAMLLSGDADLTPGIIVAQGLGIRVHLLSMGPEEATSSYLRAEVDCKDFWKDEVVHQFASANNKSPVSVSIGGENEIHKEIAQKALHQLGYPSNPVTLENNRIIPKDADGALLWVGREHFGRILTDDEKRSLRNEFKLLLSNK